MIKLDVKPSVKKAFKTAFPNRNSAEKGLNKYVSKLESLLLQSTLRGRSTFDVKKNLFDISLKLLRDYGGRISDSNDKKIYIHEWLKHNDFNLIKVVENGNPFKEVYSKVSLTQWVTARIDPSLSSAQDIFDAWFPDFATLTPQDLANDYDILDVDLISLNNYIQTLPSVPSTGSEEQQLLQAVSIYKAASHNQGKLLQKKKYSSFGRTYYQGYSIQNVNKELRRALLGGAWEYDICSSVVSWKLGFADDYIQANGINATVEETFLHSLIYSEDKKPLIDAIRKDVYCNSGISIAEQTRNIKNAMTALNFGARLSEYSYADSHGSVKQPSLKEFITDFHELRRFKNSDYVKAFKAEQDKLNRFIIDVSVGDNPELLTNPELKTASGRVNKNKLMAYLYQHAETAVMDIVRSIASQNNLTVIANIHDAIIFKHQLDPAIKDQMEAAMRTQTNNPYWALGEKELKEF
jgi:hypothetical protein